MKAMCIDDNKNFVWQDVPEPECHDEFDVKIAVKACAVNRAEHSVLNFIGYEFRKVRDRLFGTGRRYLHFGPSAKSVKRVGK